jgi:hypothetical protein
MEIYLNIIAAYEMGGIIVDLSVILSFCIPYAVLHRIMYTSAVKTKQ